MIGGPQGSGINSVAETLARACCRGGLMVFANIEYHSNIKGEHSFYRVRVDEKETSSHRKWVDLLVALDKETLFGDLHKAAPTHQGHKNEVTPGGGIIYDEELNIPPQAFGRDDIKLYPVPYKAVLSDVLKRFGKDKELSKYQVMTNIVAFGASLALVDYDFELVADAIKEQFTGRKAALADLNIGAAQEGWNYIRKKYGNNFDYKLERVPGYEKRIMMRGVQAVAIGKLRAGCGFQTYYPITPATDESEYLESHQKDYEIMVVQTEDEIAAVNMATGAAHAGVRSSTSTSGPGFSLMVEGLGWAGISEAPGPVVILYQRGGPATGLPTRTEQGDLLFALHAAHGEFPRIVMAPGDVVEAFYDTFDAFNWSEMFQVPTIVILDKHLASSYKSIKVPDLDALKIDRGKLLREEDLARMDGYKRYRFTPDGISPRALPGQKGGVWWTTGDEHDELGHISESSENRVRMMRKRMTKLETAARVIPDWKKVNTFGRQDADVTLVGWGSTKGAILDAMESLGDDGIGCNFLQVRYMSPFPTEQVRSFLSRAKRIIAVENNYSGQLVSLIRMRTGISIEQKVLKFNGRPFGEDDVYEGVMDALKNGKKEVVMAYA